MRNVIAAAYAVTVVALATICIFMLGTLLDKLSAFMESIR